MQKQRFVPEISKKRYTIIHSHWLTVYPFQGEFSRELVKADDDELTDGDYTRTEHKHRRNKQNEIISTELSYKL